MLSPRPRYLALLALSALPLVVAGSALAAPRAPTPGEPSVLSASDIERLSANANKRSIIILKNQHPEAPPRVASGQRAQAVDSDQAPVRSELAQLHSPDVKSFHIVNAVAATISDDEIAHLSADPSVQAVVPDGPRAFAPLGSSTGPGAAASPGVLPPTSTGPQAICPAIPGVPLLEPEALEVMNVEFQSGVTQAAAHDLADGSGVKVGIIADGIDPNNPDLIRPNGQHVIFDFRDFSGFGNSAQTDGRESFLDAGSIASQANQTYDLSGFVNPAHPLPPGCNIKIKGVAPGASLAVLNVAGSNPGFFNSQIIQAIEWAVDQDNVDVLNESLGANPFPNTNNDPVQLADDAAVRGGVVVVVSTGDAGPNNNIGSPATSSDVIAAGGSTTYRVYRQTTRYGTQLSPGGWLDNNITALSSAGSSQFGQRGPDVVAPGDRGWSLCSSDTAHFQGCADIDHGSNPPPIWAAGGTSASAPLTSGTAALVIEAYAQTHNGSKPSPALVKRIIVSTASDLGAPADHQGAGLVNSLKAVQLATVVGVSTANNTGNTLLVDQPGINAVAPAGSHQSFPVKVTNEGKTVQTVTPSVMGLTKSMSTDTGSVNLSNTSPTFIDGEGNTDFYSLHTFSVPAGVDYLNGDIAWNGQAIPPTQPNVAVFETLFDPSGRVAAYSLIGTDGSGRGHVEVRLPSPGTWTAVIFTVLTAHNNRVYSGPVNFTYSTANFQSVGSVSPPKAKLNPGESATFSVRVNNANDPGDHVSTLRLSTGDPTDGALPIIIRSLVPVNPGHGGSFAGVLNGGGATGNAGQQLTYQFDVPDNRSTLNVAVKLNDPNYEVRGFLIDPSGEPLDVQDTAVFDPNHNFIGFGPNVQFFQQSPASGRWTLSLLIPSPIDGTRLSEPFTGTIDFDDPQVTVQGLPNAPGMRLAAGVPVSARITITNTGSISKDYFADPRLNGRVLQMLLGSDVNGVALPLSLAAQPNWLVPTATTQLIVLAQGSAPIVGEVSALNGDPDVLGARLPQNVSLAQIRAPEVAPGFFFGLPELAGPFPPGGATGTVNLAAGALTNPFDSTIVPDSGDVWAFTVNPNAPEYTPLTLGPGQSGVITLTITPTGASGTRVRGFIGVDTFNLATDSGDEVIRLPYEYTVR